MAPMSVPLKKIRSGDWLLFRRQDDAIDPVIAAITVGGRSPYYHAGMAWWADGNLMILEVVERIGGRAVLVRNRLEQDPGLTIDVRHIRKPTYRRKAAVQAMIDLTGRGYGWWSLLRATLTRVAILRWFIRPTTDDKLNGSLPFCSQAVSRASRAGGFDPAIELSDGATEPGDLARVPAELAEPIGTLRIKNGELVMEAQE